MAFLVFFGGGRVEATLRLPAWVIEDLTLGPFNETLTDSSLRV
jgi:hypothetical protein